MLTRRIVACLDVAERRVVKGVRFSGLRDMGDPPARASAYQDQGADEIVLLDISATQAGRAHSLDVVERCRRALSIPLTVGGGVRTVEDAAALLDHGADRVSVNSAAIANPGLVAGIADRFGAQCVVVAIDARRSAASEWTTLAAGGRVDTGEDAVAWARRAAGLGAGEILLTSWDRDGTGEGYDLELLRAVCRAASIPVMASGGASQVEHLRSAIEAGADAVLAATIFHAGVLTVRDVKVSLARFGLEVRL